MKFGIFICLALLATILCSELTRSNRRRRSRRGRRNDDLVKKPLGVEQLQAASHGVKEAQPGTHAAENKIVIPKELENKAGFPLLPDTKVTEVKEAAVQLEGKAHINSCPHPIEGQILISQSQGDCPAGCSHSRCVTIIDICCIYEEKNKATIQLASLNPADLQAKNNINQSEIGTQAALSTLNKHGKKTRKRRYH